MIVATIHNARNATLCSQRSEPIELTDYVIQHRHGEEITLRDTKTNYRELWVHNQDFAGYVIRIGEENFEFVRRLS